MKVGGGRAKELTEADSLLYDFVTYLVINKVK